MQHCQLYCCNQNHSATWPQWRYFNKPKLSLFSLVYFDFWYTERPAPAATFHRILCFSESPIKFLSTLKKGTRVYVEANFELREPEAGADANTPQGQRQIFLRHGMWHNSLAYIYFLMCWERRTSPGSFVSQERKCVPCSRRWILLITILLYQNHVYQWSSFWLNGDSGCSGCSGCLSKLDSCTHCSFSTVSLLHQIVSL
jgi:hypothetical protein